MQKAKLVLLGLAIYFCPVLVARMFARWFPDEKPDDRPRNLRRRFWRSFALIVCVFAAVLALQSSVAGSLHIAAADWLRIVAAGIALTAALGRAGWSIQTWKGNTAIERVDRGMFVVGQVGAAALLVFILTL